MRDDCSSPMALCIGSSQADAADLGSNLLRVDLTQLQDEVIDTAHAEGQVKPDAVARLLLHDLGEVHTAIRGLAEQGLVESADGGAYQLTTEGRAVHRAREKAHRDAVRMNTRTWQSN